MGGTVILSGRVGMVARFKPVHNGHAGILRKAASQGEALLIGVGSAAVYDYKNPFTLEETGDMLRLALAGFDNFSIIPVPDLNNGPKWRDLVIGLFGNLDYFISANTYVRSLLWETYNVVHPLEFLDEEERTPVTGTAVRRAIAKGESWRNMAPAAVADYIEGRGLDRRFCAEFGLRTLADLAYGENV